MITITRIRIVSWCEGRVLETVALHPSDTATGYLKNLRKEKTASDYVGRPEKAYNCNQQ